MKRRRAFVVALVSTTIACAIGAACTFPDVAFAPADGGGGGGEAGPDGNGGGTDSGKDGSQGVVDASVIDSALVEAATRSDADTKIDAAGCVSCDCDNDGYFSRDGGCEGGPGAVYDCDDSDKFISPAQGFVAEFTWTSVHPLAYDWNCDGTVQRAYPTNLSCGGTIITGCTGGQGFQGSGPNCGNSADYFECKGVNGLCVAAKLDTRTQLCK